MGSQCVAGQCLLPDLTIDEAILASTVDFGYVDSASDPCLEGEGCLGGAGVRTVMRFSTRTLNVGEADFVIGDPAQNPNFEWSDCHQHYHYHQYAAYELRDLSNQVVLIGKKQGFAIIDMGPIDPNDPGTPQNPKYDGGYQGIQHGWYDEYSSGLPCQWIDITGVAQGDYLLSVRVNPVQIIAESNFDNNEVIIPVTIPDTSCIGVDCTALDSDCTKGVCVTGGTCTTQLINEGGACDDGTFCTVNNTCAAGVCGGGAPRDCALSSPCYTGTCDEANDTCVITPANDGTACDDGNLCTTGTTCLAGACTGGSPVNEGQPCDDGASCTTGTVCVAGVCGGGAGPVIYFADSFADASKGWILGQEWEIGPAVASTGAWNGANDPDQDHTATPDNGVAGVVIGGNAAPVNHGMRWLESPAFNTAGAPSVILGFYRWLNSDTQPFMSNSIEVWNGSAWVTVWVSTGFELDAPAAGGSGWNHQQINLTAYANAAMRVRFGFQVGQAVGLFDVGSWNIDDVLVSSAPCP